MFCFEMTILFYVVKTFKTCNIEGALIVFSTMTLANLNSGLFLGSLKGPTP